MNRVSLSDGVHALWDHPNLKYTSPSASAQLFGSGLFGSLSPKKQEISTNTGIQLSGRQSVFNPAPGTLPSPKPLVKEAGASAGGASTTVPSLGGNGNAYLPSRDSLSVSSAESVNEPASQSFSPVNGSSMEAQVLYSKYTELEKRLLVLRAEQMSLAEQQAQIVRSLIECKHPYGDISTHSTGPHRNGHTNGHTNGHVNGSGYTNGYGSSTSSGVPGWHSQIKPHPGSQSYVPPRYATAPAHYSKDLSFYGLSHGRDVYSEGAVGPNQFTGELTKDELVARLVEGKKEDYRRIFIPGRGWASRHKLQHELEISDDELQTLANQSHS